MPARPPQPPERAQSSGISPRVLTSAGAIVVALLAWLVWPSSLSGVKNLHSTGANVIAFGDSLTAGYGANAGEDFPSHLSSMIGTNVINAGVSGDTTDSALARLDRDVLTNNPRIVLVGLGGNDYLRSIPISTTEQNLRTIIRQIHASGAAVVLLGFRFPSLNLDYEGMYERVAKDEGCLLVPDMLDGILSDPNLRSDAIHPNGRGYTIMAERLTDPMKKVLGARD